ncbi:HlyD family efflux transporter periplasmic adaptor subunit [Poseidonibacter ostreae]|uniref:HlyD family efflux transporter periplasmic adaptor subunit n=1 Tax=Poseidonibacter ostreae TaxID=2654171 RepID=A0A6L4WU60_9BACT|nr:HlyD family efflux transporter periplasmic adaptor subunit [Poseidonibacter ostreae]KAB7889692.1 HlyD family efflux transporter periplasmic adaptor subunit [Poseidonibacter ostreae]KAB7892157.1 HlyD family efflux transporter periplasmic adaptor subunit [Poseidonibacter ostreae]
MIKATFLSILTISVMNAKIIEVEQLFNKKTTLVKEEKIGITKSFYGKTKIDESNVVDIVTRFDGFITKLNANKNFMYVKKGEPLFSIYSDDILSIQKEIQVARSINKNLYRSSLEKLKVLDLAKEEINKIKKNKSSIDGIKILSPINSIVIKKNINNKSAVKKGKLLLQLADINKLWFIAQVYQKDLTFIKNDMSAYIYIDGLTQAIKSKVDFIYPMVNEKTKTIDVRFIIDNKDLNLYPNMFASVKIKSLNKTILTLPKTAVLTKGSNHYVFKPISNREFEPIKVEAKRISSNKYEISDGLEKGDKVINNALFLLDSDAITNALYNSDSDDDW